MGNDDEDPIQLPRSPAPVVVWYALLVLFPMALADTSAVLMKTFRAQQSMRGIVGLAVGAVALVVCGAVVGRRARPTSLVWPAICGAIGALGLVPLVHTATADPMSWLSWYDATPPRYWVATAFAGLVLGMMSAAFTMPRTTR